MNCFGSPWAPDYPQPPIVLLSEQGDTALFQLYKPHTHTSHFEIARQRSARARKPPQACTERPWKLEILLNLIFWKSTQFYLTTNHVMEPWGCSFSAPCQWIDLKFSMCLDNINISQGSKPHQKRMCRSRAMTEKPTKSYELFWLTVGARSPTATNSITLRAGRYRFIPALQATYTH